MNPRQLFINYFEDLARRSVPISHDPTSHKTRRFWLGTEEQAILGTSRPDNTGWNLLLLGYITKRRDNRAGMAIEVVKVVFQVLRHCRKGDADAINTTHNEALLIGEQLLAMVDSHVQNPCAAVVSAGIQVPYQIDMTTKAAMETGPHFDNMHGYEFAVDIHQYDPIVAAVDPLQWQALPGDPPTP